MKTTLLALNTFLAASVASATAHAQDLYEGGAEVDDPSVYVDMSANLYGAGFDFAVNGLIAGDGGCVQIPGQDDGPIFTGSVDGGGGGGGGIVIVAAPRPSGACECVRAPCDPCDGTPAIGTVFTTTSGGGGGGGTIAVAITKAELDAIRLAMGDEKIAVASGDGDGDGDTIAIAITKAELDAIRLAMGDEKIAIASGDGESDDNVNHVVYEWSPSDPNNPANYTVRTLGDDSGDQDSIVRTYLDGDEMYVVGE